MSDMPSLGRPSRGGALRNAVVGGVLIASAAGAYVFHEHRKHAAAATVAPVVATPEPAPAPAAPSATNGPAPTSEAPAKAAADDPVKQAGMRGVHIVIEGALEPLVVRELGKPLGIRATQVLVRELVWWVNVPRDFQRGDVLDALLEERSDGDPSVVAIRFTSQKSGHTFRAYRFKPATATWPSYWEPDGTELAQRLKDAPLDDYEQITSLLRDGRGHAGVDFKTPLGTPVKAPFDGTVTKKNWNWKMNGNCVAIDEAGGAHRTAMFLHLSEVPAEIQPGTHVKEGQVVAKSGNTGHSFAPHLHFQLMSSSNVVLDPFAVMTTYRRTLAAGDKPAFDAEVAKLDKLLDSLGK